MNYLKIIMILLIGIFIIYYYEKNLDTKKNDLIKNILKIMQIILIILIVGILFILLINFKKDIEIKEKIYANFDEITLKINEEYEYYEKVKNNYNLEKKEIYIPQGFKYVEGNYEDGFVIEDENKNQYVWVPCIKDENPIIKSNYNDNPFISYSECYEENYKEFLESVLQNGGFYISRFQIGKENENLVSKKDVEIVNIFSLRDAQKKVESMYPNNPFKCEIINGFAYDTTLNWILKDNEVIIEESGKYTGNKEYKNIYDIIDNSFEITLEKSYSNTIVYRGFITKKSTAKKNFSVNDMNNRWFFIEENEKPQNLGIRTIIYK